MLDAAFKLTNYFEVNEFILMIVYLKFMEVQSLKIKTENKIYLFGKIN